MLGSPFAKQQPERSYPVENNIQDKVVVITGASSGLGEATARHLSALGATVVLGARRLERIEALESDLISGGGKALAVKSDVTDREQVTALIGAAVASTAGSTSCSTTPAGCRIHHLSA